MRSFLKLLGLFLILGLPVLIYIFLQNFGENKYSIPVFHKGGLNMGENCPASDTTHHIPAFTFTNVAGKKLSDQWIQNRLAVFYIFPRNCKDTCDQVLEALTRVQNEFNEDKVGILAIGMTSGQDLLMKLNNKYPANDNQWQFLNGNRAALQNFALCGLGLKKMAKNHSAPNFNHNLVLVDKQRRIRGYYKGFDIEEADRLILEMRILLRE